VTTTSKQDTTELYYAEMEAARHTAEAAYFMARPLLNEGPPVETFRAGFERAFRLLWKPTAPETSGEPRVRELLGELINLAEIGDADDDESWHAVLEEARALLGKPPETGEYLTRTYWSPDRKHLVTAHVTNGEIVTLQDDNGKEWEPTGTTIRLVDVPRPAPKTSGGTGT
jgi:hypothetical protein